MPLCLRESTDISCDGNLQYITVYRKAVKKHTPLECCNHSSDDAQSTDQQNKTFIGIIVILLYLQAAPNLSSHGIAFFFFKHTKMYVHLSPFTVNSK